MERLRVFQEGWQITFQLTDLFEGQKDTVQIYTRERRVEALRVLHA